jgi:hypothetical protein
MSASRWQEGRPARRRDRAHAVLGSHGNRRAADEVLGLLRCHDAGIPVLHWFTGTPEELRNAVAAGCWFSVGPAMLKSEAGRARAAAMPRHRVLTETDGPFGKAKGKQLEPKDVSTAVGENLVRARKCGPEPIRSKSALVVRRRTKMKPCGHQLIGTSCRGRRNTKPRYIILAGRTTALGRPCQRRRGRPGQSGEPRSSAIW